MIPEHNATTLTAWLCLVPANADLVEQVETLRRQLDKLNGDAEYLWFQAQWLRAQLAMFRGDVGPPAGHR